MQRTTHKTLALFALLLFALTSIGTAQSSKTFDSQRNSFSIKAPAGYTKDLRTGIVASKFLDELAISNQASDNGTILRVLCQGTTVTPDTSPRLLLDTLSQGFAKGMNAPVDFERKITKVTTRSGTFYLRRGTVLHPTHPATAQLGYLYSNNRLYFLSAVYPKGRSHLKNEVLRSVKSFSIK